MKRMFGMMAFVAALAVCDSAAWAQVYNLRLLTDNVPDYTDMPSFVESSTGVWQTPQDKAAAVFRWGRRSRRQTSCAVEDGRHLFDPILHYNSYGAMNCGIISSLNISCWLELGFQARYIQLGDHTVSEVSWNDGRTWHLFDSSMSFYCYNHEGQVASCDEIKQAHGCELSGGKVEPGHYYLYHGAPPLLSHLGPSGWRFAADQPVNYARTLQNGAESYTDGFSVDRYCQVSRRGHRYVLNLRPYESYTRHWRPLDDAQHGGDTAANDPNYFRPLANGSDPDDQHGLNNIRGNGVWLFAPDLAAPDRDALFYDSQNIAEVAVGLTEPHLHPAEAGELTSVTYKISAANVITSLWIDADAFRNDTADQLSISVSRTAGIRWQQVWQSDMLGRQPIALALRDQVAGVTQCLVRIEMLAAQRPDSVGIGSLKFRTITQLNRRAIPKLTLGSNQVVLTADEQLETTELWPPLHDGKYQETVYAESGVFSDQQPDGQYKATLGAGVNGQPGWATWRLAVPTDIVDVALGVISTNRSPRSYVSLQYSWDGQQFDEFDRKEDGEAPFDKQVLRTFAAQAVPAGTRQTFFRGEFFCQNGAATYNMPGIQDLLMRVRHRPRRAAHQAIEVTYHWTEHRAEGDIPRSHTELVARLPHRYTINTAGRRDPTMNWVRINFVGYGPADDSQPGYSDGQDVGSVAEYPKVAYRWGQCLSAGRPYTTSRQSSTASGNADADGCELTNGVIIAPTDHVRTKQVQAATAFWDEGEPVVIVIDLDQVQPVAGVRIATHQPNAQYGHPQSVDVAISTDGRTWTTVGSIEHDDLFKPPGDYEAWEHDDNPRFADLPATGRLAYIYPLALERTGSARYVRFVCTPQAGRGMGLSELQVFDHVDVTAWPAEIDLTGYAGT
jgi:hypothetical protein